MKNTIRAFCAIFLGLVLLNVPCFATVKQVTTVSAAVSTILTPGRPCNTVVIQNNGSGSVRISIDGGTTITGGVDPTASTGVLLPANMQLVINYSANQARPVIRAILVNATTTTLDIVTDDLVSI